MERLDHSLDVPPHPGRATVALNDAGTEAKEIRAAYVTTYGSSDIRAWSGTGYHIHRALQSAGLLTASVQNLRDTYGLLTKAKKVVYSRFLAQTYLRDREALTLKSYAAQVRRQLASTECDVVLSPGTIPIAYLRTDKPVVFWTDSTFAGVLGFYPEFSKLCAETIRSGHRTEQRALSMCRLAIFSSDWAATTAIQNYDVNPEKIKVVPFGANIDCDENAEHIAQRLDAKQFGNCQLLFIGVDWSRKGGAIALAVAELLNRRGLETTLHIVGYRPPHPVPPFVTLHGYVSKHTEVGRKKLTHLFKGSHFLIVPSQAECFGVVYAEASCFGLPSLATSCGGIPSAVVNDRNGRLFGLDADPDGYADYIGELMSSPSAYKQLARSSFEEYSVRLNWSSAGQRVRELMARHCV